MGSALFAVIIAPLVNILEFFYVLFDEISDSRGIAVVGLSFVVTICTLPLYMVAEKWQEEERRKQDLLRPGVKRIKAAFKGDEQYMILTTFYRQNHYHPLMALRSSFSLLIQIPFFIAAYTFLSHLEPLRGYHFLFINDFGSPDGALKIGSLTVNVLPILMTVINCVSGAIYSKGHGVGEKVQIFGCAAVFLILLYNSPAGLVVYWTMNNVLSLVKNIFYKIKNPKRVIFALYIIFVVAIIALDYFLIFVNKGFLYKRFLLVSIFTASLAIPFAVAGFKRMLDTMLRPLVENKKQRFALLLCSVLALCLLAGFVIPSYVINSSVIEFADIDGYGNPLFFLYNSTLQVFGLTVFWTLCIYFLFNERIQTGIAIFMLVILFVGILDTFLFTGDYGLLSRLVTFSNAISIPNVKTQFANGLAILAVVAIPFLVIYIKQLKVLNAAASITLIAEFAICIVQAAQINIAYGKYEKDIVGQVAQKTTVEPVYHLSKTGRNVVVFMFDRAESAYLEPIFETFPELHTIYDGFVFYKNTASFNQRTMLASAALFGGYEYTPLEINRNTSKKIIDKQNEALLVLPRIFTETAGFDATVTDSSYANQSLVSDMSICDPYPKINGFNTQRRYTNLWIKENPDKVKPNVTSNALKRNLAWYSLFRMSPPIMRYSVYDDGSWWSSDEDSDDIMEFLDVYSSLAFMTRLTDFSGQNDAFFSIVNETTHSGQKLQAPNYEPAIKVTDIGPESIGSISSIHGNIAMFKLIGEWIEYLKENECYDNTRIIMVADHGIGSKEGMDFDFPADWAINYNPDHVHPLLFVKDFNSHGDLVVNYDFMTNADTPSIALDGIVEHPVNPFTGKEIRAIPPEEKKAVGVVLGSRGLSADGRTFRVSDADWYTIEKNIFDAANWKPYTDIE